MILIGSLSRPRVVVAIDTFCSKNVTVVPVSDATHGELNTHSSCKSIEVWTPFAMLQRRLIQQICTQKGESEYLSRDAKCQKSVVRGEVTEDTKQ